MVGLQELRFMKLIFCFIFIVGSKHFTCSAQLKLDPKNYYTETSDDAKICKRTDKIILGGEINSAFVFSARKILDNWNNLKDNWTCSFIVKAPMSQSLFAVVHTMSFKKVDGKCLDWVKFESKSSNSIGEICELYDKKGSLAGMNSRILAKDFPFNFGQFDPGAEIQTTLFVSKETIQKYRKFDLEIIYTPYELCHEPEGNTSVLLPPHNVCMKKHYICDGIQNCYDTCNDEKHCEATTTTTTTTSNGNYFGSTTYGVMIMAILIGLIGFFVAFGWYRSQSMMYQSINRVESSPYLPAEPGAELELMNAAGQHVADANDDQRADEPPALDRNSTATDPLSTMQSNPSDT